MKTMLIMQSIDQRLNQMAEHALKLERDNMLLKRVVKTMANNMHTEDGEVKLTLTESQAEFIKYACDTCDVFNTGGTDVEGE